MTPVGGRCETAMPIGAVSLNFSRGTKFTVIRHVATNKYELDYTPSFSFRTDAWGASVFQSEFSAIMAVVVEAPTRY